MKKSISLVLLVLFAVSCAIVIPSKTVASEIRKTSMGFTNAVIRTIPFDPEKILRGWKALEIYLPKSDMAVVVSGNPKIEWTPKKIGHAFEQPIPPGEVAAAVGITLVADKRKNVLLVEFMFVNPLGIIELYVHDQASDTFIRQPHYEQRRI